MASLMNFARSKALVPLIVAAIIGAVGGYYLAGVNQTNEVGKFAQQNEVVEKNQCTQQEFAQTFNKPVNKKDNNVKAQSKSAGVTQESDTPPEGYFYIDVSDNLEAAITSLQLLPELIANKNFKAIAKFKQQLLNLAKKDSAVLDEVLLALQENLNNEDVKYELLQVLSQIKDPKVETLAQNLALSNNRDDKLTGLDLLANVGVPNKETLDIAFNSLQDSTGDPQILQSAMRAMPNMLISSEKNREILNQLEELSHHQDESVRSESLFAIAKQAKRPEQLTPLVNAMQSGSIDERISAVMAIEKSTVTGDQLKSVLLTEVQRAQSLPEVRAMAASSLQRFDLSTSEISILESYRKSLSWNAG